MPAVIGPLTTSSVTQTYGIENGGFKAFDAEDIGIKGLAQVNGSKIDFLALLSNRPGALRRLITSCKLHYKTIGVWSVWNPRLTKTLSRYGFEPATAEFIKGDPVEGMIWKERK